MQALQGSMAAMDEGDGIAGNGLLNNLVAYWGLDEAGGANNALDKHSNGLTLTQASSPGSDTGLVYAGARTFDGLSQYFSRGSEALLQAGNLSFVIGAWVRPSVINAYMGIVSKWGAADAVGLEYSLRQWNNGTFQFVVANSANAVGVVQSLTPVTANQWSLIVAYHDADNDTIGVTVNNSAPVTTVWTTGVKAGTNFLFFGRSWAASTPQYYNGRIGPVQFWKNCTLDAAARTALYNAGAGLAYSAFTI